eukprot:scaffold176681_cov20-Tisochrysis_lutea.AAC.3
MSHADVAGCQPLAKSHMPMLLDATEALAIEPPSHMISSNTDRRAGSLFVWRPLSSPSGYTEPEQHTLNPPKHNGLPQKTQHASLTNSSIRPQQTFFPSP